MGTRNRLILRRRITFCGGHSYPYSQDLYGQFDLRGLRHFFCLYRQSRTWRMDSSLDK